LIRQGKVEQVYSVMQTGTSKGMQTMEQALAELVLRNVIALDDALSRSSRPEQLFGLLERSGMDVSAVQTAADDAAPLGGGLRLAEA
jgi:twitching motility protein PilT